MPDVHLDTHLRACGAYTLVVGQASVFVDGKLLAVDGDPNTHGLGNLKASVTDVFIEGKPVIVHAPDIAYISDSALHSPAETKTGQGFQGMTVY